MIEGSSTPPAPIAGVILAGGRSTRMGEPKESVILADGRPMLLHVLDALRSVELPVYVSGKPSSCSSLKEELQLITDLRPDQGPLGGIEAVLHSGRAERYLFVSTDQPLLRKRQLEPLIDAGDDEQIVVYRSETGRALDPFPGVIPASLAGEVSRTLDKGERSVRRFLRNQPVRWITLPECDERAIISFNTRVGLKLHGIL